MNFLRLIPSNRAQELPEAGGGDGEISVSERDRRLVERCKSGDSQAFDELVTFYRGKVYAMILNMIHNDADAWDLSQDVFVKAWKALPKFEERSAFYTWLYRITHNVTYDWIRKRKRVVSGEFDDALIDQAEPGALTTPKSSDLPDAAMERSELRGKIARAIETLSDDHREVILLKEIDGLSYQEIADVVDCSVGTVMSRLFYARKKLQAALEERKS
ncbi:MAG: sigma-70 family RNA polymerase sigma factor [Verrucomicrobiales bacterium]|nr:sigma-70 family RNA polymerase sigma factor [Verrucomicrobiales bacterium]